VIELERGDAPGWPGGVATIWLARPEKRNALNYAMWAELEAACGTLRTDPDVRVVLLRGRGDHFCAGADIVDLHAPRAPGERSFMEVNLAAEQALATLPFPTVAVLQGDVVGGGCALAIDCDLRVATSDARFGITPAKLGLVYPVASIERATRLLGPAATKRLLFTGELIGAADALHLGLVDSVHDAELLTVRVDELVTTLAARSLLTQAATKEMVTAIGRHGHVPDEVVTRWTAIAAAANDAREGTSAFTERRTPHFTWRPTP
jgi:enoyl-CoA hydratase/carnithine racemase